MLEGNKEIYVSSTGGIGRVIASTGAIQEFAKQKQKEGIKVNVVSSFPQLFNGLDYINRVYNIGMPYLYEDYISKGEFIEPEPYNHYLYYKEQEHLATVFNFILNGKREFIQPSIVLTENELEEAKGFVEDLKKKEGKKILLVQPWGSQGGIQIADEKGQPKIRVDESYRSFGTGFFRKFIGEFKDNYKIMSVQATAMFNNQQVPQVALKDTSVFQNPDIRKIIAVIPFVDGVIACDSFLHHASASLGTPVPTIVLWGATSEKNLGYEGQTNLRSKVVSEVEPNRVPHDHVYYVNKNKGSNEFKLELIEDIRGVLDGNKSRKNSKK
jgi:hypothetical protein